MSEIPSIRPRRTLNGKFDAYCHVCWFPVYAGFVDDKDPAGKCIDGHADASRCATAARRAHSAATLQKVKAYFKDFHSPGLRGAAKEAAKEMPAIVAALSTRKHD